MSKSDNRNAPKQKPAIGNAENEQGLYSLGICCDVNPKFHSNLLKKRNFVNFRPAKISDFEKLKKFICRYIWTHGTFSDNHRNNDNFIQTQLLVLDIDNIPEHICSLEQVTEHFADYKHIIATSKSHRTPKTSGDAVYPPDDRLRVILFLEEPITSVDAYNKTWQHVFEQFPIADIKAKDAAHYWLPCNKVVSANEKGALIPVVESENEDENPDDADAEESMEPWLPAKIPLYNAKIRNPFLTGEPTINEKLQRFISVLDVAYKLLKTGNKSEERVMFYSPKGEKTASLSVNIKGDYWTDFSQVPADQQHAAPGGKALELYAYYKTGNSVLPKGKAFVDIVKELCVDFNIPVEEILEQRNVITSEPKESAKTREMQENKTQEHSETNNEFETKFKENPKWEITLEALFPSDKETAKYLNSREIPPDYYHDVLGRVLIRPGLLNKEDSEETFNILRKMGLIRNEYHKVRSVVIGFAEYIPFFWELNRVREICFNDLVWMINNCKDKLELSLQAYKAASNKMLQYYDDERYCLIQDYINGMREFFELNFKLQLHQQSEHTRKLMKELTGFGLNPGETEATLKKRLKTDEKILKYEEYKTKLGEVFKDADNTRNDDELIQNFIQSAQDRFPLIWRFLDGDVAKIELRRIDKLSGAPKSLKPTIVECGKEHAIQFTYQNINRKGYKRLVLVESPFCCLQIVKTLNEDELLTDVLVVAYGSASDCSNGVKLVKHCQRINPEIETVVIADKNDSGQEAAIHIAESCSNTNAVFLLDSEECRDVDDYLRSIPEKGRLEKLRKLLEQKQSIGSFMSSIQNEFSLQNFKKDKITDYKKDKKIMWRQKMVEGLDCFFEVLFDGNEYFLHILNPDKKWATRLFKLDSDDSRDIERKFFSKFGLSDFTSHLYKESLETLKAVSKPAQLILWSFASDDFSELSIRNSEESFLHVTKTSIDEYNIGEKQTIFAENITSFDSWTYNEKNAIEGKQILDDFINTLNFDVLEQQFIKIFTITLPLIASFYRFHLPTFMFLFAGNTESGKNATVEAIAKLWFSDIAFNDFTPSTGKADNPEEFFNDITQKPLIVFDELLKRLTQEHCTKLNALANGGNVSASRIRKRLDVQFEGIPVFLGRHEHKKLPVDTANRFIEIETKGNLDEKKAEPWHEAETLLQQREKVMSYCVNVLQQVLVKLSSGYEPAKYYTRSRDFERFFWASASVLQNEEALHEFFQQATRTQNESGLSTYPEVAILLELFDGFYDQPETSSDSYEDLRKKANEAAFARFSRFNNEEAEKYKEILSNIFREQDIQYKDFVDFIQTYAESTKAPNKNEIPRTPKAFGNRVREISRLLNHTSGVQIHKSMKSNKTFLRFEFPKPYDDSVSDTELNC